MYRDVCGANRLTRSRGGFEETNADTGRGISNAKELREFHISRRYTRYCPCLSTKTISGSSTTNEGKETYGAGESSETSDKDDDEVIEEGTSSMWCDNQVVEYVAWYRTEKYACILKKGLGAPPGIELPVYRGKH